MPRMSLEACRTVRIGQNLYHHIEKNRDGTPLRARVNGRLKVWKRPRSPQWQLPMKYGIKHGFYINETTMDEWFTLEDEAALFHRGYTFSNEKHHKVPMNYWFIKCAGIAYEDTTGVRHFTAFEDALQWAAKNLLLRSAVAHA